MLVCALLDVPVYGGGSSASLVEALHLLFTLYSAFKSNPYFGVVKRGGGGSWGDGSASGMVV
jgi:hypothetical protein